MELRYVNPDLRKLDRTKAEAVCVSFFDDERPLRGAAGLLDWRLCGLLSRAIEKGRVDGTTGEVVLIPGRGRLPFDKVLAVGLGPSLGFDADRYRSALERTFERLEGLSAHTIAIALPGRSTNRIAPERAADLFWSVAHSRATDDEIIVIDEPDAQKAVGAILDRLKKRM